MKTSGQRVHSSPKLIAVALVAAFGSAYAADDINSPDSSVSVGIGMQSGNSKDRALWGQYTGMRNHGSELLLDADIVKRDDETGTWTIIRGRNLGLDNRDLGATYQVQGAWKISADYSELVRRELRTVNTSLQGAGTTTPTVTLLPVQGTGAEFNPETKRKGLTLNGEKWLSPNLLLEASFSHEKKDGSRLWGRGIACGVYAAPAQNASCGGAGAAVGAVLFLPEPISSTTRQAEVKLNYSGESLKLSGGYYGSFYNNAYVSLTPGVPAGLVNPDGTALATGALVNVAGNTLATLLAQPMALPPDNQAHQLSLSGTYAFTPTTRSTFRLAYTHATQNQDFSALAAPGFGFSSLGGVVNTTLAQVGLTSRPMTNLSVNANLRYEDRNDKTPYNALNPYTVSQNSWNKLIGKLEGTYRMAQGFRATLGLDYQDVDRDLPVGTLVPANPGFSGVREHTHELGYRADLSRSMSENLNATIGFGQSRRTGSAWVTAGYTGTAATAFYGPVFPVNKADRKRDKVKLGADWSATDALSLQFFVEDGKDRYDTPGTAGLRDTGMRNYGVDAAWTLSAVWKLTGYLNQGTQTLHVDHLSGDPYMAELKDIATTLSIGAVATLSEKVEFGGNLMLMNDSNRYQVVSPGGGLPDATYRVSALKLYGRYAIEKNADIRIDLMHQRTKFDEWSWIYNGVPFAYSDNTTVAMQQNQNVTFLGASYIYKFK